MSLRAEARIWSQSPRQVLVTIKRVLGVFAVVLVAAAGWSVTAAPSAVADTYCGKSGRGASVYADNSETSCEFAMKPPRSITPRETALNRSA